MGKEGGAGGTESDDDNGITALRFVVVEKADFLRIYPLMCEPLRALDKLRITVHEVLERLTALAVRAGRLGTASRQRGVA